MEHLCLSLSVTKDGACEIQAALCFSLETDSESLHRAPSKQHALMK